jgi:hypothetical protein
MVLSKHPSITVIHVKTLPVSFLDECFSYDPKTGVIIWKHRPRSHFKTEHGYLIVAGRDAGKKAGREDRIHGYCVIGITYEGSFYAYPYHHIAFALYWRRWPKSDVVDHRDRNPANNKIKNLRECSHGQNMANQRGERAKRGQLKGAYWNKQLSRWQSAITINYKQTHLGYFDTEEAAHGAYVKASKQYHGEYGRSR